MEIAYQNNKLHLDKNVSYYKSVEKQGFFRELLFFLDIKKEDVPEILSFINNLQKKKKFKIEHKSKFDELTNKEKEVLALAVKGFTSKRIGKQLYIQTSTVSSHRKSIKQKLDTQSLLVWKNFYDAFKNTY